MAKYGFKNYESDNLETFKRMLNVYVKGTAKSKLLKMLKDVAEKMVQAIDGDRFAIPVYTGNLHDATGVAVYADGVMQKYIPTQTASKAQHCGFGGYTKDIWGTRYLQEAMDEAATTFSTGIWIVLFSTVPYAYHIDMQGSPKGRGQNFFGMATQEMVTKVFAGLEPIAKSGFSPVGELVI